MSTDPTPGDDGDDGDVVAGVSGFPEPRDFVSWLLDHTGGRTNADLGAALREVTAAVKTTEKKGSITVTFTVEPVDNVPGAFRVSDKIDKKVPELPRPASTFFSDDNDDLVLDNPRQGMFRGMPARR